MALETVQTPDAPAAIGPYSQGIVANGFLFTAGQVGFDPATQQIAGDIAVQTARVLENLRAILATKGLAWENVVKTTVYLQRMSDFAAMNEVYAHTLGSARPARSTVEVAGLPRGALVEIDVVAALRP
jgi:2-iminobutanoate/2-iminopropanoate deaminase